MILWSLIAGIIRLEAFFCFVFVNQKLTKTNNARLPPERIKSKTFTVTPNDFTLTV